MSNRRKAKPRRRVPRDQLGVLDVERFAKEAGLTVEEAEESIEWLKDNKFLATYEGEDGRTRFIPTVPEGTEQ